MVIGGLYRFVRHPLYTFSLLVLWLSPSMTVNTLIVYAALTIYILIGAVFEERKLLRQFGQEYAHYKSVTPMLIPGFKMGWEQIIFPVRLNPTLIYINVCDFYRYLISKETFRMFCKPNLTLSPYNYAALCDKV